jgi:hypothetical protein
LEIAIEQGDVDREQLPLFKRLQMQAPAKRAATGDDCCPPLSTTLSTKKIPKRGN